MYDYLDAQIEAEHIGAAIGNAEWEWNKLISVLESTTAAGVDNHNAAQHAEQQRATELISSIDSWMEEAREIGDVPQATFAEQLRSCVIDCDMLLRRVEQVVGATARTTVAGWLQV